MEPYLDETAYHDTPNCTFPFGTTSRRGDRRGDRQGRPRALLAVDDVGKKINPMIVDGQLHGGIAQGVGQALLGQAIYSDDGQLLTGSMLDYALPRAAWFPNIELDERSRRRRSTRSASRASARRARSPAPPPWPTPSTTRSGRSASAPRHAVHAADGLVRDPGREGGQA